MEMVAIYDYSNHLFFIEKCNFFFESVSFRTEKCEHVFDPASLMEPMRHRTEQDKKDVFRHRQNHVQKWEYALGFVFGLATGAQTREVSPRQIESP